MINPLIFFLVSFQWIETIRLNSLQPLSLGFIEHRYEWTMSMFEILFNIRNLQIDCKIWWMVERLPFPITVLNNPFHCIVLYYWIETDKLSSISQAVFLVGCFARFFRLLITNCSNVLFLCGILIVVKSMLTCINLILLSLFWTFLSIKSL